MKKLVIAAVALMISIAATYAQGQVNFNNKVAASGVNARVLDSTGAGAGAAYAAGLAISSGGALTYVPGTSATFRTTPAAATGYINPLVATIPGHDVSSSVSLVMFGFKGAASDAAASAALAGDRSQNFGMSNPVTVALGGGTILPPDMVGLQGFTITVPEPSTIAFGLLGAAALLIRRRK
jgi:hypothetical protein